MGSNLSKDEDSASQLVYASMAPLRSPRAQTADHHFADAASSLSTHIHDLPSECLVEIICRVRPIYIPVYRQKREEEISVQHPLQCSLVCRRWRSITDGAIFSLSLRDMRVTDQLAKTLGQRFRRLSALTFAPLHPGSKDALLVLAQLTPQLECLALPGGFESSLPDVLPALSQWRALRQLNLGNRLCSRNNEAAVEAAFDAFCSLPLLESLRFRYVNSDLPAVCTRVGTMSGLTTLELESNNVPPETAGHLSSILRVLELHHFEGPQLPNSLGLFKQLEALSLDAAEDLTSLPSTLGQLTKLTMLELTDCQHLKSLPLTLAPLRQLKVFQVKHCPALLWPRTLADLQSLQTLVMTRCGDLPRSLGRLKSLRNLKIDNFQRLPEDIGDLPFLRKLELGYGYGFLDLPCSLGRLSHLQVLRLQFCPSLTVLPSALGMLTGLKELDILNCGNQLEELPESLGSLTGLEVCKISGLPCLRLLPEGITAWRKLKKLEISWCDSLRALPEGLGSLRGLKELEIAGCWSLVSLPKSLGALETLQVLRVRACPRLTKLPESLEGLGSLRVIRVWDCDKLEPLPESLRRLCLQFDRGWL